FNNGEAVYLSHDYSELLPNDAKLVITFTYTLAPAGESGYYEYSLELELNLNFKIGLSSISVPQTMLINVPNKTLIKDNMVESELLLVSGDNSTVNVFEEIKNNIAIISVNDISVKNIPNFNLNPIKNE